MNRGVVSKFGDEDAARVQLRFAIRAAKRASLQENDDDTGPGVRDFLSHGHKQGARLRDREAETRIASAAVCAHPVKIDARRAKDDQVLERPIAAGRTSRAISHVPNLQLNGGI